MTTVSKYYKLEQDNIRLKEKLDSYHYEKQVDELQQENKKLEEKLRKYEILQYTPNELEIELNKYSNLKQKIDELIEEIKKGKSYEVACCEGETCTVTEQTEDLLKEILKDDK